MAVDSKAKKISDRREKLHENHASSRPLSDGYEYVGIKGELAFEELTGLPMDQVDRASGDKGIDFEFEHKGYTFTIDVKTARKPYNLIVEIGKVYADIFVLAKYLDANDKVTFLGWEYGEVVLDQPSKDFGYGVINHYIPAEDLKPMEKLVELLSNP